jgi:outer membrane protein OmpA-like peptidoglycan-associated protein
MKTRFTIVLSALIISITQSQLPAQEARKLEAAELDVSFSMPASPIKRAGGKIAGARGAHKPGQAVAEVPVEAQRSYARGARIITYADGQKSEAPYAEIPLLFVKGKAELLADTNTQSNVALLAAKVKQYGEQGGRFVIEGHASAEGDGAANQFLSEARATFVYQVLTQQHGVPAAFILRAEGRGARDAQAPATANEKELEKDRKVLAVKEQ